MSEVRSAIRDAGTCFRHSASQPVMTRLWLVGVAAMLLILCGSIGYLSASDGARGIPVGIFRVKPSLSIQSRYDSNVFKDATNRVGEKILSIQPVVQVSTHWKSLTFSGSLASDIARYESRSTEDYQDYKAAMHVKYSVSRRLELGAKTDVAFNHDSRGAADVGKIGANNPPRHWKHYGFDGSAQYTYNRLRTLMELSHQIDDKLDIGNYLNKATLSLMFALAPRTSLLTEVGWKGIVYDSAALDRDNQERSIGAGVSWTGAAKTQGDLRVGYTMKEYENSAVEGSSAFTFGGGIGWKPLAKTALKLDLSRNFAEGGLVSNYYVSTSEQLGLTQKLRSFLTFNSNVSHTQNDYSSGLENEIWKGSAGFGYAFPRWLTMDTNFTRTSQKSNQVDSGYDSDEVMVSLTGGL
ncbi:MAG: outer membrane beta-barrel protein [Magnetococcales bacterium]|nr:outer membrane beta-barrel protein [Magnetococcales bacterium]